jgi:hypothetical protein|tara:strand:+ start:103 stop:756 length:654 start_codon:yes stop_codon:yes gene_type:complete
MLFPTYVVDNFFEDPDEVINLASTLKYKSDPEGRWPGKRSDNLFNIEPVFFDYITNKIMRLIFPYTIEDVRWNAHSNFQLFDCKKEVHEGWVHKDIDCQLSAIIYLSRHQGCGTSLFQPKKFARNFYPGKIKEEYYSMNKKFDDRYFNALNDHNSKFEKTLEIENVFNKLILFDAHQWHAANGFFDKKVTEGRLTLVVFFNTIFGPNIKFPMPEMRR